MKGDADLRRRDKEESRQDNRGCRRRREKGKGRAGTREVIFRLEREREGRKREEKKDAGLKNL